MISKPTPLPSVSQSSVSGPLRPAKILIADDDPVILTLVEATLRGLEPEPELQTATNGTRAIRLIDQAAPDLVITDIRMPGADGLQLLAHVVNQRLKTTVIAMTGYATAQLRADVLKQGAYLLLEKPLDPDELLQAAYQGLADSASEAPQSLVLSSILQLIEMESKSCEVAVSGDDQGGGFLVFQNGRLVHARTQTATGDAAVLYILALPAPYVDVRDCLGNHPNTVTQDLEILLREVTLGHPETDPRLFETMELPTGGEPLVESSEPGDPGEEPSEAEPRLHDLMKSVRELRGFRAASLVDLQACRVTLRQTTGSFEEGHLLATPICRLLEAEKALIPDADDGSSHILIRQSRFWHLIRELKGALALHIVFEGSSNVALAQYRLARWLVEADLAEELPPEAANLPAGLGA